VLGYHQRMSLDRLLEAARADPTTVRDWLRANPPEHFRHTLAHVATRVTEGEDFFIAMREFLDQFMIRPDGRRQEAIDDVPSTTGDARHDAFLAGLAEHLAWHHSLHLPTWTNDPTRFLDRFWFVSSVRGFRAILIAHSPAAFRRRGIFVHPDSLVRY